MIAEIKGKVNIQNTNLTELREDELTGNFFGNLRYIPFNKGLKQILKNAVRSKQLQQVIDEIDVCNWNENLHLWEKVNENGAFTELDVRLDFPTVVIGIEVKYQSGLSSEDDNEVPAERSVNQLSREARVLRLRGVGKKKVLLLLANESMCAEMCQGVKIIKDVQLGYISWQEVLIQLKKLTGLNDFEQLVVSDLIELLEKKGFLRFSGFEFDIPNISDTDYWHFKQPE